MVFRPDTDPSGTAEAEGETPRVESFRKKVKIIMIK